MQAERNRACSELLRRSLPSSKVMQAERNRACSELLRRSLSYAKVMGIVPYNKGNEFFPYRPNNLVFFV